MAKKAKSKARKATTAKTATKARKAAKARKATKAAKVTKATRATKARKATRATKVTMARKPATAKKATARAKPARPAAATARTSGLTEKTYRALVVARLAELRSALIDDLVRRVFVYPFPEGTKSLDYEIHFQTLNGALPLTGYLMDGQRGQVMLVAAGGERVLASNIEVLPSVKPVIPWSKIEPFDDAAVEMLDIHAPLLRDWFIEAWTAAGGKERFRLPASISFHDDDDPTPLPTAAR